MLVAIVLFFVLIDSLAISAAIFFHVTEAFYDFRKDHARAAVAARRTGKAFQINAGALLCMILVMVPLAFLEPDRFAGKLSLKDFLIALIALIGTGFVIPWIAQRRERRHLEALAAAKAPDADHGLE